MNTSQYGPNEFSNQVALPEISVTHFDHADTILVIPVEPGTIVRSVALLVEEAFAGGTPAITVGDGVDADGFLSLVAGDIDTIGKYHSSVVSGAMTAEDTADTWTSAPFAGGKNYTALGKIVVTLSVSLTAGKCAILVEKINLAGDWRKPAL